MTTSAHIRNYRWNDLEPLTRLFNTINGISDTEKAYDSELLAERLSQPPCRPEEDCYLAESQESLVGFALLFRLQKSLAIGALHHTAIGQRGELRTDSASNEL